MGVGFQPFHPVGGAAGRNPFAVLGKIVVAPLLVDDGAGGLLVFETDDGSGGTEAFNVLARESDLVEI